MLLALMRRLTITNVCYELINVVVLVMDIVQCFEDHVPQCIIWSMSERTDSVLTCPFWNHVCCRQNANTLHTYLSAVDVKSLIAIELAHEDDEI